MILQRGVQMEAEMGMKGGLLSRGYSEAINEFR